MGPPRVSILVTVAIITILTTKTTEAQTVYDNLFEFGKFMF